jgi:hypothetical protein
VTIQVVLLVGLIVAHVTPAIKEDPLNCTQCSVSDPDPNCIRIQSGQYHSDPGGQNDPKKFKKVKKF